MDTIRLSDVWWKWFSEHFGSSYSLAGGQPADCGICQSVARPGDDAACFSLQSCESFSWLAINSQTCMSEGYNKPLLPNWASPLYSGLCYHLINERLKVKSVPSTSKLTINSFLDYCIWTECPSLMYFSHTFHNSLKCTELH